MHFFLVKQYAAAQQYCITINMYINFYIIIWESHVSIQS